MTGTTFRVRERGWACGVQPFLEHCCSLLYECSACAESNIGCPKSKWHTLEVSADMSQMHAICTVQMEGQLARNGRMGEGDRRGRWRLMLIEGGWEMMR